MQKEIKLIKSFAESSKKSLLKLYKKSQKIDWSKLLSRKERSRLLTQSKQWLRSRNGLSCLGILGLATILMSFESFNHSAMNSLESQKHAFAVESKGLTVTAKRYTSSESSDYLDQNLLKLGYQPIQITIQNNTSTTYELSRDGISLPTASPNRVALSISAKSLPRSIGLRVASMFFWPFMIPSTLDSIATMKTHYRIHKDYTAKSVKEKDEAIAPYSVFHRVIFVPKKGLKETLTVTLLPKEDREKAISYISSIVETEEKIPLERLT
ncbi:MAG: hypothetical protein HYX48_04935 [Chlamydiales bacterium]|nr:hypothetical protein [Chlamydiales bacterium]